MKSDDIRRCTIMKSAAIGIGNYNAAIQKANFNP